VLAQAGLTPFAAIPAMQRLTAAIEARQQPITA